MAEERVVRRGGYIGCPPERFLRYRKWRNTDDTCGAWAAAVMLAYYQDYISPEVVRSEIRTPGLPEDGKLAEALRWAMNGAKRTIPPGVRRGVQRALEALGRVEPAGNRHVPYEAAMWMGFCGRRIERELRAGRPCCLGMLRMTGSTYGNHWVTAYGFEDTPEGRVYICHDNWGNTQARIPARWINSMVYLKKP